MKEGGLLRSRRKVCFVKAAGQEKKEESGKCEFKSPALKSKCWRRLENGKTDEKCSSSRIRSELEEDAKGDPEP